MSRSITVDLNLFNDLAKEIQERAAAVHLAKVPPDLVGRERSARLATISKELLFLSHLCDKARVAALDEYHAVRGFVASSD